MDTTESIPNGTDKLPAMAPATNCETSIIPAWVNEDHFIDVLEENVEGFKKILSFEVRPAGGAGENYASVILRIKVEVELKDGTSKEVNFMMKTLLQGEQAAMMVNLMGLFPKEKAMYSVYLPEFEQMYRAVGKEVRFGPKFYKFKKEPEADYILMDDLAPRGFKNVNRLEGFDQEHSESVLRLLADLHAASAVHYEVKGDYDESFVTAIFTEKNRQFLETMAKALHPPLLESLSKNKSTSKYVDKIKKMQEVMTDLFIELGSPDFTELNVIIHGDLWANNIMFRHNEEGIREETVFIDFQGSRFASPAVDLFYFLLSSTQLDLKLSKFDNFVKYYFDHLTENLKLLNYPKKLPTMKDMHMQLLKQSFWGVATITGVLAAALLDPTEAANFDTFVGEGEEGKEFKMQMFDNPRYMKHMATILPWLDTRGFLD